MQYREQAQSWRSEIGQHPSCPIKTARMTPSAPEKYMSGTNVRHNNINSAPTTMFSPRSISSTPGDPLVSSLAVVCCTRTSVATISVNDLVRAYCGFFIPCVCGLPVYFLTSVAFSPWRPMDFTLSQPCLTAGWTFWFWTCASMLAVLCAKAP